MKDTDHQYIFIGIDKEKMKPVAYIGDLGDKDITDLGRANDGRLLIINPNTRRYMDDDGVWHSIDVAVKLERKGPRG